MGRFDALTTFDNEPVQPADTTKKPESQNRSVLSPLPDKQEIDKPASMQTGLHANQQTSKDASMQTDKQTNIQTSKQVNLQTGKQVFIEKYSSYLTHEHKRELKRLAFESDRKEYEVLMEAVEQYLAQHKHHK
jgi:trehalose/maltose hydrolase-like predicted phosphorylase